jgi:hypothetical protein
LTALDYIYPRHTNNKMERTAMPQAVQEAAVMELEKTRPMSIGVLRSVHYNSQAEFFIDDARPSGVRQLIVRYERGGFEGEPEMTAEIPDDWTILDVADSILGERGSTGRCPKWEVPLRVFGSKRLFRWWAGEKAERASLR